MADDDKKKTEQVTVRLPVDMLSRLDDEAKHLERSGYRPDRAEVMRMAMARGLEAMLRDRERDNPLQVKEYGLLQDVTKIALARGRRGDSPSEARVGEMTLVDVVNDLTTKDQKIQWYAKLFRDQALKYAKHLVDSRIHLDGIEAANGRPPLTDQNFRRLFFTHMRGSELLKELERLFGVLTDEIGQAIRGRPSSTTGEPK